MIATTRGSGPYFAAIICYINISEESRLYINEDIPFTEEKHAYEHALRIVKYHYEKLFFQMLTLGFKEMEGIYAQSK